MTIKEAASEFLAHKRIAVTGVSRTPKDLGSNVVFKRLRSRGYEVFAVNPNADEVEGTRSYHDLRSIPGGVDAVVIATAAAYGRQHGVTVIDGGCPLMFEPTADFGHKVLRVFLGADAAQRREDSLAAAPRRGKPATMTSMNIHMLRSITAAAALAACAASARAADGVLITEKTTTNGTSETTQVQIEKTRMRAEATGPNNAKTVVIFDGNAQVIRMIDMEKKTYTEMTKADVDRMADQMAGVMAQMQDALKNMPPEQRAQMEQMMRGRGMPAAAPAVQYRKTGTDRVGRWTCDKYEGSVNGQKTSELCTVNPSALGFTPADFEVTRQMADFFKKLVPQNADQLFRLGSDDQGFSGIPVRQTHTAAGATVVGELVDITRQNFPDSIFAVPAGFQKQAFPSMGAPAGGRRGR